MFPGLLPAIKVEFNFENNMQLQEIIIERIRQKGAISFRDFMEICLYHPQMVYYTSNFEKLV